MTEQEFKQEIRRHLIAIMRAFILYYGMSWLDFIPKEENSLIVALSTNQTSTRPPAPYLTETKSGV